MSRTDKVRSENLMRVYERLLAHFGHRRWWPADGPVEVCIGAVLTQNTAWLNVARAIDNLKDARALSARAILALEAERLAELIRPSGYYNLKAKRLQALMRFIDEQGGRGLSGLKRIATEDLRERLLAVYGVGPETADSILLYALGRPVFVVDAYTRRIAYRLGWTSANADYATLQRFFTERLPSDVDLFNDFHAQIVALGASLCRPKPRCADCPLEGDLCPRRGVDG